jgi:glutamate-ammonia-ligase adenylyltransferase
VISPELKQAIQALRPNVDQRLIDEFIASMDAEYFATFTIEDIASHIQMSSTLDADRRVDVRITSRQSREFDIVIAGFDYLSQFSIFCGLLSAFGLDIRGGDIYSFAKSSTRRSSGRVVDVFRVALRNDEVFDEAAQREFERELHTFATLLAQASVNEARERLNRFLTERIERMDEHLTGLLSPVELRFDNDTSSDLTVMNITAGDSFAFLYAISNALSMRGIYIGKVKIRGTAGKATDQFFISDRWGRKIVDPGEQKRLRLAVGMLTQFTHYLPVAADPGKAMRHFDQMMDRIVGIEDTDLLDRTLGFLAGAEGMNRLAHLLGSSDYLWNDFLRTHFDEMLPILENAHLHALDRHSWTTSLRTQMDAASSFEEKRQALNRFKDRQLFLIDIRHLFEPQGSLEEFSHALTDLAEVVLEETRRACVARLSEGQTAPPPNVELFTVCSLGKFGGREMGYASDLEIQFVHDGPDPGGFFESLARQIVDFIDARQGAIFHIDLRLRPHGDAGAWCASLDQFRKYYSPGGAAAPFERQALIKLRWCAGNEALGRQLEAHRDEFTYGGHKWDWDNAMHLRRRQMQELSRPGEINVKYGAGGIVDIEYAVQYLQLLNGGEHREVRVPGTLDALNRLRALQIVREEDFKVLRNGYGFLRKLIDALRIVRGDASDLILPASDSDEFKSLARRLGYGDADRSRAAERLLHEIRTTMEQVHAYFARRFSRVEQAEG